MSLTDIDTRALLIEWDILKLLSTPDEIISSPLICHMIYPNSLSLILAGTMTVTNS